MNDRNYAYGFTIVELLIVIVVIGILAAISMVAYRGMQERSRITAVTSSLVQAKTKLSLYKAERGVYPTTSNISAAEIPTSADLAYQYTSVDGFGYCLTATRGDVVYRITDTTSATQGGCDGHTWPGGVVLTNMITNGDFSQGTTGWGCDGCTISATGDILTATLTSVFGGAALKRNSLSVVSGAVYYIRFTMTPFRTHNPNVIGLGGSNLMQPKANANTATTVSGIVTATMNSTSIFFRLNDNAPTGMSVGSEVAFRNITIVNLTTAFGAGNEPTKEQMDTTLQQFPNGYFSGTVTASM